MVHYITPYSTSKNFGGAINEAIERLNPNSNDWICLRDGDSCFLTPDWGVVIENATKTKDYDLITCVTNRLRAEHQTASGMFNEMDLKVHYNKAIELKSDIIEPYHFDAAGFFMLFRVSHWLNNKFRENTPVFDRSFTRTVSNGRVGIMRGLYVLHLYRLWSDDAKNDVTHLLHDIFK